MKIKCKVDQAAALRAGIDAPHSTVTLEVDPATLTQDERDTIAVCLVDGHDLTQRRLPDGRQGERCDVMSVSQATTRAGGAHVVSPTMDGLRVMLRDMLDGWEVTQVQARERARRQEQEAAVAAAQEQSLRGQYIRGEVRLRDGAAIYENCVFVRPNERIGRTPEMETRITIDQQEREQEQRKAKEAAAAAAEAVAAKEADQIATIAAVIAEMGSVAVREKLKRGLIGVAEARSLARLLLTDATLPDMMGAVRMTPLGKSDLEVPEDWDDSSLPDIQRNDEKATVVSDDDMLSLMRVESAIIAAMPDATITPWIHSITRDHSDWVWVTRTCARVTVERRGMTLTRDYAL